MQITDVQGASKEAVNHPSHYAAHYRREVIELTARFDFSTGNAMKYVLRCRFKALPAEDLQKANWYLNYFIDHPEVGYAMQEGTVEILNDFLADLSRPGDDFGREAHRFLRNLVDAVNATDSESRNRCTREASDAVKTLIARASKTL